MNQRNTIVSVIGLGYVGLPVAVAFSKVNYKVIGFDVDKKRIDELSSNFDKTGEISNNDLEDCKII